MCIFFCSEIQRTLMELLNQMDGFDSLGQVKMIMATNRPDTLDPALLRPGKLSFLSTGIVIGHFLRSFHVWIENRVAYH